jgi:RNA polymerase sigma-70 factor, ECF subfamily
MGQTMRDVERRRDTDFESEALPEMDHVYRFAFSLVRDGSDAEDLVQETYLRAFRSWHTYLPGSDCRRWLFRICRNCFLRSRERERHTVFLDDGDAESFAAVVSQARLSEQGADSLLTGIDLAPALKRALDQLREPFRSAVLLVDLEEQSYDAASDILGVPVGTVRSRLFRGRRLLQEMLVTFASDAGLLVASPTPSKLPPHV